MDESTDVSSEKHDWVFVLNKYYSVEKNELFTQFLCFVHVDYTTGEAVYNALKEFCTSIRLSLKNILSIGTDGASNMVGKNVSLYSFI